MPALNSALSGLFKSWSTAYWPSLLVFGIIAAVLIYYPLRDAEKK